MGSYDPWFAEHGIVEWSTALAYLATALIAAGLWLRRERVAPLQGLRLYLCIVFLLALVAFLDEVSFGKDLVGYPGPVVVGHAIGSVHDVTFPLMLPAARAFRLAVGLEPVPAILVLTAAAIAVAGALAWVFRHRLTVLGRGIGGLALRPAVLDQRPKLMPLGVAQNLHVSSVCRSGKHVGSASSDDRP